MQPLVKKNLSRFQIRLIRNRNPAELRGLYCQCLCFGSESAQICYFWVLDPDPLNK
jgi:hypothetical protein